MEVNITPLANFTSPDKNRQKINRVTPSGYRSLSEKLPLTQTNSSLAGKPSINPPVLSVTKLTQNNFAPIKLNGNKGVLLYQQTERIKSFSNNSEVINRFNLKV